MACATMSGDAVGIDLGLAHRQPAAEADEAHVATMSRGSGLAKKLIFMLVVTASMPASPSGR